MRMCAHTRNRSQRVAHLHPPCVDAYTGYCVSRQHLYHPPPLKNKLSPVCTYGMRPDENPISYLARITNITVTSSRGCSTPWPNMLAAEPADLEGLETTAVVAAATTASHRQNHKLDPSACTCTYACTGGTSTTIIHVHVRHICTGMLTLKPTQNILLSWGTARWAALAALLHMQTECCSK